MRNCRRMVLHSVHLVTAPQSVTSVTGLRVSTKINKPPVLPHFSGADPLPKDKGSYDQWRFQVVGAQKVCTEEAVHSAIICSMRGEVREMISFLGFDVDLDDILEKVEKWFGKQLSCDCLQQEFYQLAQDKNEKVRQFAGRLEQKYKYLKEKFPDRYQTKDLKDRLFHGMHSHICESKKPEVTYEELLSETLEAEKDCCSSKSTSVKSKAAIVESEAQSSLQKLTEEISALTTVVKYASMGTLKTKTSNHKTKISSLIGNGNKGSNASGNSPRKGKGPAASAAGPFKSGQKPLQCYKCGGWGHTYKECALQGGIDWRGLNGAALPPEKEKGPEIPKQN